MKKLNKFYAAFIICAIAIMFTSCSQNPVDKMIDDEESLAARIEKLVKEKDPSKEEFMSIQNELLNFWKSNQGIKQSDITESQKKRFEEVQKKMRDIMLNTNFMKLERLSR